MHLNYGLPLLLITRATRQLKFTGSIVERRKEIVRATRATPTDDLRAHFHEIGKNRRTRLTVWLMHLYAVGGFN